MFVSNDEFRQVILKVEKSLNGLIADNKGLRDRVAVLELELEKCERKPIEEQPRKRRSRAEVKESADERG